MPIATREAWLLACAESLRPMFEIAGAQLPRFRVTMSEIAQKEVLARCYSPRFSADDTAEIVVRLDQTNPIDLAAILAHELSHAAVGVKHGHRRPFVRLVRAIGLQGPPTATYPSDAFIHAVAPMLEKLGPFPHAKLHLFGHPTTKEEESTHPKDRARLIKVFCAACGYTCRVTRKWLNVGAPSCPSHGPMNEG